MFKKKKVEIRNKQEYDKEVSELIQKSKRLKGRFPIGTNLRKIRANIGFKILV